MNSDMIVENEGVNSARTLQKEGRLDESEAILRRVIEREPHNGEAYHLLGIAAYQRGSLDRASELLERAITCDPSNPVFFCNLGMIRHESNDLRGAINHYSRALEIHPLYPEALNNLGNVFRELRRFDEALDSYQKALSLGVSFETVYNLGTVCADLGRLEEAMEFFRKALLLKPNSPETCNNIAVLYMDVGEYDRALDYLRMALALRPDYAESHVSLGVLLREIGEPGEAVKSYGHALRLKSSDAVRIKKAMVLPVIPESRSDIVEWRKRLEEGVDRLFEGPVRVDDPVREVNIANFYLAYHGMNDKELQTKISRLYEKACPSLLFQAPHAAEGSRTPGTERIKIGFVSRFLRNHTIGKYVNGLISNMSRETFDIYLYFLSGNIDETSRSLAAGATKAATLPPLLESARRQIAEDRLDILFYPEIGMDPFTYFLAFARLAPVQCAFYGHPDTTGLRNIDFFISHEDCEPEGDSQSFYSERLLKVSSAATYAHYSRPSWSGPTRSPVDFGLDEKSHLYLCPQSLFKIHPDMDDLIKDILNEDRQGVLIMFEGRHPHWTELILKRLTDGTGLRHRVKILPPLSHDEFLTVMASVHAVLDTTHFSGGNTSFDAFSVGAPVVTLPGSFMRGRQTYALYKRMGIMDCIAKGREEYTATALRLGNDPDFREAVRGDILARNHLIFDDANAVTELEHLLMACFSGGPQP